MLEGLFFFLSRLFCIILIQSWGGDCSKKKASWNFGLAEQFKISSRQSFCAQSFKCATAKCCFFAGWWVIVPLLLTWKIVSLWWSLLMCTACKVFAKTKVRGTFVSLEKQNLPMPRKLYNYWESLSLLNYSPVLFKNIVHIFYFLLVCSTLDPVYTAICCSFSAQYSVLWCSSW